MVFRTSLRRSLGEVVALLIRILSLCQWGALQMESFLHRILFAITSAGGDRHKGNLLLKIKEDNHTSIEEDGLQSDDEVSSVLQEQQQSSVGDDPQPMKGSVAAPEAAISTEEFTNDIANKVQILYGRESEHGYVTWSEEPPYGLHQRMEEASKKKEKSLMHALVKKVRVASNEDNPGIRLDSVIVQSKLLQPLLRELMAELDMDVPTYGDTTFETPFRELYFNLEKFQSKYEDVVVSNQGPDGGSGSRSLASHFQLFYDIVMEELKPILKAADNAKEGMPIDPLYQWALFRPGTLLYVVKADNERLYRVKMVNEYLSIDCEYITWDGKALCHAQEKLFIHQLFKSSTNTLSTSAILEYRPDKVDIGKRLHVRGTRFLALCGHHVKEYNDVWRPSSTRSSRYYSDPEEHLKDRIIVNFNMYKEHEPYGLKETTEAPFLLWDTRSGLDGLEKINISDKTYGFTEEDFMLCDAHVHGYALASKQWGRFHVRSVQDIVWNETAFGTLVLDQGYKNLIHSIVDSHMSHGQAFDDFVQGKGLGLTMLFAGPPGVGKTLAAESLGDHMRKPLYVVSAAELGVSASAVERELDRIFKLSLGLDLVVLIDEADVFLQARTMDNLERNAVIAVFLRVIERFSGTLLLTSNRLAMFDEAFLSRIHIVINFPELGPDARRQVWKAFLDASPIPNDISEDGLTQLSKNHELNGRQIKNAIKSAQLLASRPENKQRSLSRHVIEDILRMTLN